MSSNSYQSHPVPVCPIAPSVDKARQMLVEETLSMFDKNAPKAQQKLLKLFVKGIEKEDICFFHPELLATTIAAHWEMLCSDNKFANSQDVRIHVPPAGRQPYKVTAIEISSPDLSFLVNSIASQINKHELLISILNHPIFYVKYDSKGRPCDITDTPCEDYLPRSCVHLQIKRILSNQATQALKKDLLQTLSDVYMANRDWPAMLGHLKAACAHLEAANTEIDMRKYCDFLSYLYDNNFTLLGYREYKFIDKEDGTVESKTIKGSSLGLLHNDDEPAYINKSSNSLPDSLQKLRRDLPPVSISKTNRISSVHRYVPMDTIAVKVYDDDGNVVGERLFMGLFTSTTYSQSISKVPYLREKMQDLLRMFAFLPGSHNYKVVRHILEKYHRDELFQIDIDELKEIVIAIMRLAERQRIALFMRSDKFVRYISCLVYVPRDRFGTDLRLTMQNIIERELDGVCVNFATALDDSIFARVIYIISVDRENISELDSSKIELMLQEAGRTWAERLTIAINNSVEDEALASNLSVKYANAFPVGYADHYETRRAVFDIFNIEKALKANKIVVDLYRPTGMDDDLLRLKVYSPSQTITLSDVMPILENMGLRAISELPFEITPYEENRSVWIHDFLLKTPDNGSAIVLDDVKRHFESAFFKIWYRETENDQLNRLVITSVMNWHEVAILRAYVRYLKQICYPLGRAYMESTLTSNPLIARTLVDLFKALHRPSLSADERKALEKKAFNSLEDALNSVTSLDQDRILRTVMALIKATMRTNYFQKNEKGMPKHYLTLKLKSSQVPDLPAPRPFMEIFVSSPRMEGVHLRGGKIARGGLRWSDRPEDYRTEILGLMKAQMVKNAVIVPMGSKGGFVLKNPPTSGGRKALMEEGIACYKILISAMLDVTDNRKGEEIVPPKDVVRHDGDDPYLVVAADKGTATFSDIANGISKEYGFWLDDAFASGGSAGYDHKKMGITARGAWESVKMHFRALEHDTQTQPFDVVGVGDMGGDVFGNGMLLSNQIRLIGAFNHMHIFCDPDPDIEKSFAERKRLFDGVMGWDKYNKDLLSEGGRIYNRADKSIKLTQQIKKRFGLKQHEVAPDDLIRAILKAQSDLLWFGGIGTYIKAQSESNSDVGDKANDALRLNAKEIGARVIGEGANLGVTQLGRIEFAKAGGRINADFIDNSGGVDCSDHEVNIKILLADVMQENPKDMTRKSRDVLLEAMTEEIATHVLRDNYHQSLAIYMVEVGADSNLRAHDDLISQMEKNQGIVRSLEGLPEKEEVVERLRKGQGLTRPEICVLLAHAKINLDKALLDSDIPNDPKMVGWLMHYFPVALRDKYAEKIKSHQLAREIISTSMAGHIINRMGPTFIPRVQKKTSATQEQIVRAYLVVREALGLSNLWTQIQTLGSEVTSQIKVGCMHDIAQVCEHSVIRLLTDSKFYEDSCVGRLSDRLAKDAGILKQGLMDIVSSDMGKKINKHAKTLKRENMSNELSLDLAQLSAMSASFDISGIACESCSDLLATGAAYFTVGQHFHIDWLRSKAHELTAINQWQSQAVDTIVDTLYECQIGIATLILYDTKDKNLYSSEKNPTMAWLKENAQKLTAVECQLKDMRATDGFDLSILVIAEQLLRGIYS